MLDSSYLPQFLQALLREKFFNACIIHEDLKKNEKNIFCLDCCHSICTHCLDTHGSHRLLQIRRYIYHDVIRVGDAEKLMDCAYVQSYITNNAKVVFLNKRALTRPCRGTGNPCITCDRVVQDSYLYCSLFCKYLLKSNCSLSKYIFECESMTLPEQGFDDGAHMTPESVLEIQMGSLRTSSGSSGSGFAVGEGFGCTATTETVVRKKRSSISSGYRAACRPVFSPVSENSAGLMNRRKGTPHRSPLY